MLNWVTTWSEPLVAGGTPTATLQMGAGAVNAALVSGSGTFTLTFRYVVQPADTDADGVALVGFATDAMRDHAASLRMAVCFRTLHLRLSIPSHPSC